MTPPADLAAYNLDYALTLRILDAERDANERAVKDASKHGKEADDAPTSSRPGYDISRIRGKIGSSMTKEEWERWQLTRPSTTPD